MPLTTLLTMPVGRKVSDGLSIRVNVQNTAGEDQVVDTGELKVEDGFFGMVAVGTTIPDGETGQVVLLIEQGEYETKQITVANAFNVGDLVYWDGATRLLTTTGGTNRLVGRVTNPKDANNVIWFLMGPQATPAPPAGP